MTPSEAIRKLYAAGKIANPWPTGMRILAISPEQAAPVCAARVVASNGHGIQLLEWESTVSRRTFAHNQVPAYFAPDIDDHATRGCLLALIREASDRPIAYAHQPGMSWVVYDHPGNPALGSGWTEGEALAVALVRLAEAL